MTHWRLKLHTLSHSTSFIWKCSGAIIFAALLVAMLAQSFRDSETGKASSVAGEVSEEWFLRAKEIYSRLEQSEKPSPDALADFLRILKPASQARPFDPVALRYGPLDFPALFRKHLESEAQSEVFADFMRSRLLDESNSREDALQRLQVAAMLPQPVRFANEFVADLLMVRERRAEALKAYVREGSFADAHRARSLACSTALILQDKSTLRSLCNDARFRDDMGVFTRFHVASLLEDQWMMVRSVGAVQWHRWTHSREIPLALLAATVWYLILVYSASRERWRWLRYLPPVLAGVLSVCLLHWWQGALHYGMSEEQQLTPTHELFQWVMYVGVPEEVAKLCFFLPFLPFLLRNGSASKAALTAGCVGLGFALDENLGYYQDEGGMAAVGRFVTANFMHIALTGILGGWLYELLRSRFHKATEFLMAFLGVAAAHGVYDFSSTESAQTLGVDLLGIVILALAARFYLDRLRPEEVAMRRRALSSTFVFCIGCSLLTGAAILLAVDQADSMKGAASALRQTVAIIPVALIYIHEFREL